MRESGRLSPRFLISFLFLGDENLYDALCFDDSEFEYMEDKDHPAARYFIYSLLGNFGRIKFFGAYFLGALQI